MNEFFKNYLEKKGFNFHKKIETLQINIINLEDELFDELIEKFNNMPAVEKELFAKLLEVSKL